MSILDILIYEIHTKLYDYVDTFILCTKFSHLNFVE